MHIDGGLPFGKIGFILLAASVILLCVYHYATEPYFNVF